MSQTADLRIQAPMVAGGFAVFVIGILSASAAYSQTPMPPVITEIDGVAVGTAGALPVPGGSPGVPGATGWQHTGVTLKSCGSFSNGTDYVLDGRTTPLTVDGCDFTGRVVRIHGAVTLRRSRIVNDESSDCAGPAIAIEDNAGPVVIEDVEIATTNPSAIGGAARQDRTICIWKGNTKPVTIRRVWTHDTMRGLDFTKQNNIVVEDSYLGPNVSPPTGSPPGVGCPGSERAHASSVRAAGGTYNIAFKNTVFHLGACSWSSGLIATYPENGANHDWEVAGGRWIIEGYNSGAYGVAAGYTPPESRNYNFAFHDIEISTQYNSGGCPSGCAQSWSELGGTNSWTNVRKYNPGKADHGQLISP